MIVSVTHKREFGKDRFYPSNKVAQGILSLMNRSSFTETQLFELKGIGFIIEWSEEPAPEFSFHD